MIPLLALLLALPDPGASPAARFEEANARYRAGDFAAASEGYEALLADRLVSPALHLNLGNARFRLGLRGRAIASWERALLLDPGDEDARANLLAVRADDPDRALTGEPTLLARIVSRTGDGLATGLFAIPWWILWGALVARARRGGRGRRLMGAVALAAAAGVLAGGLLLTERARARRWPAAVVVSPVSPARDGPSPALRPAFELHEGTRVVVREASGEGDLVRVRLEGGLEGWVARGDLEPL